MRFNSSPIHPSIFSFFPYAVYPVSVTTYWCYFSCIIAHNSLPVYRIPAKAGTEMCLYTPLLCAKVQSNRIWRSRFIAVFVSVQQEEEKTKKLSQFLKSNISGTRVAISLKFVMWSAEVGGHVHSKNRLISSRQHRATEVRKLYFFLPVNILTDVTCQVFGSHDTLPCVCLNFISVIGISAKSHINAPLLGVFTSYCFTVFGHYILLRSSLFQYFLLQYYTLSLL